MDQELLHSLQQLLAFLAQARSRLEGEAAVAAAVNEDLARILDSLRSRSSTGQASPQQPGRVKQPAATVQANNLQQPAASAAKVPGTCQQHALPGDSSGFAQPAGARLPPSFLSAVRQLGDLQQQLQSSRRGRNDSGATVAALPAAAASGFMQQLEQAYSAQASQQWPAARLAQQRDFVGVVAAALWLIQVLCKAEQHARPALQPLLHSTLRECGRMSQQQPHSADEESLQIAAACWRNRCLRSVLAAAAAQAEAGGSSCNGGVGDEPSGAGLWLPGQAWQLLPVGHHPGGLGQPQGPAGSGSSSANVLSAAGPQWLTPGHPMAAVAASNSSQRGLLQPGICLCYSDAVQLQQHSKQQQKLQQLLMHCHIEQRLAPRLLEHLVKACGCLVGKQRSGGSSAGMTEEQCVALYRLLHALTCAAPARRGLSSACHPVHACLEPPPL